MFKICPLCSVCLAKKNGTVALRPVKSKKQPRKIEPMTVFVLKKGDSFLIRKRPETGLLAGLYELPHTEGKRSPSEAAEAMSVLGVRPAGAITQYERVHVFTHREWHMRVYAAEVSATDAPDGYLWYDGSQSIPTAFGVCLT